MAVTNKQVLRAQYRPTLRDRVAGRLAGMASKILGEQNLYSGVFTNGINDDEWNRFDFFQPTVANLIHEGQKKNAAVYASVSTFVLSFIEPEMRLYKKAKGDKLTVVPVHLLADLLRQPNPIMGQREFCGYIGDYLMIGGNAYAVKIRGPLGQPVQLWPFHAAQMYCVAGGANWIDHYVLVLRNGDKIPIDPEDVVHIKWPIPDPHYPWLGQAPLMAVAREIATDNEMTRYIHSLLSNDAVPRNALTVPYQLSEDQVEKLRNQWARKHGGEKRGGLAVLEGGLQLDRVALNMEELAVDALRNVPEGRIAAVTRVPAQVSGLNVGLQYATYSNFEEANSAFTLKTLSPIWTLVGSAFERDLLPEFEGPDALRRFCIKYDCTEVMALSEDQNAKSTRIMAEWNDGNGIIDTNEARSELGYPEMTPEQIQAQADAAAQRFAAAQQAMASTSNGNSNNDNNNSSNDTGNSNNGNGGKTDQGNGGKALHIRDLAKKDALKEVRVLRRLSREVAPEWKRIMQEQADRVIARIREEAKSGKRLEAKGLSDYWLADQESKAMYEAYVATMRPVIQAGADSALKKVASTLAYDTERITDQIASRASKDINATTARLVAGEIADGMKAGYTVDQIVDGVEADGFAGIKGIFEDWDRSRAVTIARSETAIAYNQTSADVYHKAGVTSVYVNDGDYDEECASADGQVWTVEYAQAHPIEHPNCTRTFDPILA